MASDGINLILHSHLESEGHFELGWSPELLEEDDRGRAANIVCLEALIGGIGNDNESYDSATGALNEFAWQLRQSLDGAYLVFVSAESLPKARVRSHKGLFPYKGQIKDGEHIELEVDLDNEWSYFMGMTPITEGNREECFSLATDVFRAFIVLPVKPDVNVYHSQFLKSIIPYLNTKGSITINKMRLIVHVCNDDLAVLTFGYHDPRGEHVNQRIFFQKTLGEFIREAATSALHSMT